MWGVRLQPQTSGSRFPLSKNPHLSAFRLDCRRLQLLSCACMCVRVREEERGRERERATSCLQQPWEVCPPAKGKILQDYTRGSSHFLTELFSSLLCYENLIREPDGLSFIIYHHRLHLGCLDWMTKPNSHGYLLIQCHYLIIDFCLGAFCIVSLSCCLFHCCRSNC